VTAAAFVTAQKPGIASTTSVIPAMALATAVSVSSHGRILTTKGPPVSSVSTASMVTQETPVVGSLTRTPAGRVTTAPAAASTTSASKPKSAYTPAVAASLPVAGVAALTTQR
jgi:hypothetical protein